jgi:hypothetical protein
MGRRSFGSSRRRRQVKTPSNRPVEDILRDLKKNGSTSSSNYRDRSLAIHGLICAKCGREFEEQDRHLLTVHHKDGNHYNNPPDGSNWENLCVYCHEDEHSRETLGDYFSKDR